MRSSRAAPGKKLSDEDAAKLQRFYVALVARPANDEIASARAAWETARAARSSPKNRPRARSSFAICEKPRESFVMLRGQYDKPGEKVEPGRAGGPAADQTATIRPGG